MKNVCYLLTGGNIGDRPANLAMAEHQLGLNCGKITGSSSVYETEAWGFKDQPAFLNQAIKMETPLDPRELLAAILAIEQEMGRVRNEKNGPRVIDIDILFYNDAVIDLPELKIPHPQLHKRRFALACLNDIAASHVHPLYKKTVGELLLICEDRSKVNKF
jgi:2-amino-4-hydroxy-6-hydroxymethyldihydropteridine diphosphokinase